MLLLPTTSTKLTITTSAAGAIDCEASFMDNNAGTITPDDYNPAQITTATTVDLVPVPGASVQRNVVFLEVFNTSATVTNTITIKKTDGTNSPQLWVGTLLPGESVNFTEDNGWQYLDATGAVKSNNPTIITLRVTADVTNATTSFADVTGLTYAMKSGKVYSFKAFLIHVNNASTTGSQFGVNIGAAPTALIVGTIDTVTPSVTASAHSAGVVTALDTAITAQTTGSTSNRLAVIAGFIQPSADGTFAIRCKSEVAVASGLVIKAGSFLEITLPSN